MPLKSRTRAVTGRVTQQEEELIKQYAIDHGTDVSNLTRDVLLREVAGKTLSVERQASALLLELFVRTMEASLELGEEFTVQRFRKLCAEVHAEANRGPQVDGGVLTPER